MAHHKNAKKRIRQIEKRNERNRYVGKTTRNAVRNLLAADDKKAAEEQLPKVVALIDKLAKRNQIHSRKAARLKSAVTRKVNTLA